MFDLATEPRRCQWCGRELRCVLSMECSSEGMRCYGIETEDHTAARVALGWVEFEGRLTPPDVVKRIKRRRARAERAWAAVRGAVTPRSDRRYWRD
jgi:hypothetical protein